MNNINVTKIIKKIIIVELTMIKQDAILVASYVVILNNLIKIIMIKLNLILDAF